MKLVTCIKCNGAGFFRAFSHIHGGVCFRCNGTGQTEAKTSWKREAKIPAKAHQKSLPELMEIYKGDPRIEVPESHGFYYMHVLQVAEADGLR